MTTRPIVAIVGAGFAGLGAASKLHGAPLDIVLIDKNDYHTFQPMLYQVASGLVAPTIVGYPIREVVDKLKNLRFYQANVTNIDLDAHRVIADGMDPLAYDYLLIALGATVNFFGVPGASQYALPLYTLADALRLKNRVLEIYEAANRQPALVADGALRIVIVGGGPTGVELAGELNALIHYDLARDFPNLPLGEIVVVDAGAALLRPFKEKLQAYALETLRSRGVNVRLNEHVASVGPDSVTLASGETVKARTVVWAGGLQANPIATQLGEPLGHGGRVTVGSDLSLSGRPEAFIAGDIALATDTTTETPLPQLGSVALQAGECAGENIARRAAGKPTQPFAYHDRGTMATIAREAAVLQIHDVALSGPIAWLAWGAVHLSLLSGSERRLATALDWSWTTLTRDRSARIVVPSEGVDA